MIQAIVRRPVDQSVLGRTALLPGLLATATILLLVAGFGPDADLALLSVIVFVIGGALLWRPGEPPVLALTFWLGWVGASIATFYSNFFGMDVNAFPMFSSDMRSAISISLVGLLFMALGMRVSAGRAHYEDALNARTLALSQPISVWFNLYVLAAGAAFFASGAIWLVPGLSQIILGFTNIKWAFFFMLAYATLVRGSALHPLLMFAFLFELVLGLGGFFSDFKTVFLTMLLAAAAAGVRLNFGKTIGLSLILSCMLGLLVIWNSVKGDYRLFVSKGTGHQTVEIDYKERMGYLFELVNGLNFDRLAQGAQQTVERLSYVEFFGAVLLYVPAHEPYTEGAILADALLRPLMPRVFFADKTAVDDSVRSAQYTGGIVSVTDATSISLGYIPESYIDFGPSGMLAGLTLIGFIYGSVYKMLVRWVARCPLLGMGLAVSMLQTVGLYENSFTKIFGGLVATLIAAWLVARILVPRVAPWLSQRATL